MRITVLPPEVAIKYSVCPRCKGFLTAAVKILMDRKSKSAFTKEVNTYNLEVKEALLSEFKKQDLPYCTCYLKQPQSK